MSKFSHKDFFGDPLWPTDLNSESRKLPDSQSLRTSPLKKQPQNQEPSENSCSSLLAAAEAQDTEDLQKAFLMEEQKMIYSNLKHSEITYLDDYQKGPEFSKDDLESSEELSESEISEDSQERNMKRDAQRRFEKELENSLYNLPDLYVYQSESESSMSPEPDESYKPERTERTVVRRPINLLTRRQYTFQSTVKIEENECKLEEEQEMISEIINEHSNVDDESEREKAMQKMETKILKKLHAIEKSDNKKVNKKEKVKKQQVLPKRQKTHKYRILSESQKQYLVYLSTISTTCEVARRFNISVNNICRWKKGTKRKSGAGRKIVNAELEERVIEYVRELIERGEPFSRRQVQVRARQLSGDENFKASKGWFERFYNRNIEIFVKSSSYRA